MWPVYAVLTMSGMWRSLHILRSLHKTPCYVSFPGAQPVSFSAKDLEKLEKQEYAVPQRRAFRLELNGVYAIRCSFWVAEKSDGIRVLLFVHTDINTMDQMVYLVSCGTPG